MSMAYCPECHSLISDKALICPACGFSASVEGSLVPLSSLPPAFEPVKMGELVLSVERKTGELLPQLRSVETGRAYEKARLHIEQLPDNLASSLASVQPQLSMAELLSEIHDVAYGVEWLHLESRGNRIAGAKAVWCQLEQSSNIQDGRLRQQRFLDIAGAATKRDASSKRIIQFSIPWLLVAEKRNSTASAGSAAKKPER